MLFWRGFAAIAGFVVLNLNLTTCRSSEEHPSAPVTQPSAAEQAEDLPQVDTSELTKGEKKKWGTYVGEILAPCPDQPVSIAQCVKEARACETCVPAAQFIAKRVRRGDPRADIETAFRLRFSPDSVKSVPVGDAPWKGTEDAPVVIVEWADFECPFCRAAAPVMDDLLRRYPDSVKLVFKNYPLSMHPNAEVAARAVIAARSQGKFWKLHEALFNPRLGTVDAKTIQRVAGEVGLDVKQLEADMASKEVADILAAEKEEAAKLGLKGTPLVYVNGREYDLGHFQLVAEGDGRTVAAEDIDDWIQLELKLRTGKASKPQDAAPKATASAAPPPAPSAAAAR